MRIILGAKSVLMITITFGGLFASASVRSWDTAGAMRRHAKNADEAEAFLQHLGLADGTTFQVSAVRATTNYPHSDASDVVGPDMLKDRIESYEKGMQKILLKNPRQRNADLRKIAFEPFTMTLSVKHFNPGFIQLPKNMRGPDYDNFHYNSKDFPYRGHFEIGVTTWMSQEENTWDGKVQTIQDYSISEAVKTSHFHVIYFDPENRHVELSTLEMIDHDRERISIWVTSENGEDYLNVATGRGLHAILAKTSMSEMRAQALKAKMDDPEGRPEAMADKQLPVLDTNLLEIINSGNRRAEIHHDAVYLFDSTTNAELAIVAYAGDKPKVWFEGASFVVEDVTTGSRRVYKKSTGQYVFMQHSREHLTKALLGEGHRSCTAAASN